MIKLVISKVPGLFAICGLTVVAGVSSWAQEKAQAPASVLGGIVSLILVTRIGKAEPFRTSGGIAATTTGFIWKLL